MVLCWVTSKYYIQQRKKTTKIQINEQNCKIVLTGAWVYEDRGELELKKEKEAIRGGLAGMEGR